VQARNAMPIDMVLKSLNEIRAGQPVSAPAAAPKAKAPMPSTRVAAPSPEPRSAPARTRQPAPAPVPAPIAEAPREAENFPPEPSGPTQVIGDLSQLWNQIVEAAGRASPFTKTYLMEAHPVSLERNVLTIGFDPEFADHISLVDNAKTQTLLQTKLKEFGHAGMLVKFVESDRPADFTPPVIEEAGSPESSDGGKADFVFDKEQFKNDPLIKEALEIFKGEIVDIRK